MSVEDVYGCKRSISVPGISVNVRRVKVCYSFSSGTSYFTAIVQPTAKFYIKNGIKQVTILEDDETELPLRLTGDGVRLSSRSFACGVDEVVIIAMDRQVSSR